ncbi:MAG: sulfotransferase domain-containing protein [Bacteroidota bacterium]
MENKKNFVWIASYPKSGNTWVRMFLAHYINDAQHADFNLLNNIPIASSRNILDEYAGVNTSDLTPREIEELRPRVYEKISSSSKNNQLIYFKIHDAYHFTNDNLPIVPGKITKGVIYIIRNPLDIVISFAEHMGKTIDNTIELMSKNLKLSSFSHKLGTQISQQLMSWSLHVKSWVDLANLPVKIFRYEDLLDSPGKSFKEIIHFLDIPFEKNSFELTLVNCKFKNLHEKEKKEGFKEKISHTKQFFNRGTSGNWKNILTKDQVEKIKKDHHEIMKRFGYL